MGTLCQLLRLSTRGNRQSLQGYLTSLSLRLNVVYDMKNQSIANIISRSPP